ncbi:hypothetical protein BVC80_9095g8 [Macleaya cordata]|uniref:Uncharacterized protein n=1 Tax=Macleaya cordata TaxID=56857 RepID=A0A200PXA1_MACCD|nr:hypothetical protein BVC80_9095g8 [Macleaya cordata]
MEDVEMAVAEGASQDTNKTQTKFHVKKSAKFQVKQLKGKGKNRRKSKSSTPAASVEAPVDAMCFHPLQFIDRSWTSNEYIEKMSQFCIHAAGDNFHGLTQIEGDAPASNNAPTLPSKVF